MFGLFGSRNGGMETRLYICVVMTVLWSDTEVLHLIKIWGKKAYQPLTGPFIESYKESMLPEITKVFSGDSVLIQGLENSRSSKENLAPPIAT